MFLGATRSRWPALGTTLTRQRKKEGARCQGNSRTTPDVANSTANNLERPQFCGTGQATASPAIDAGAPPPVEKSHGRRRGNAMQENRSHDAQADGRPQQIGALEPCVIEGVSKIVEGADAADSEEGDGGPLLWKTGRAPETDQTRHGPDEHTE